jgi:hypothetical protein
MFNALSWQSHEPTKTLLTVSLQPARRVGRRFNGNNKISLGKKKERNFPRKAPQNDDPPAKEKKERNPATNLVAAFLSDLFDLFRS